MRRIKALIKKEFYQIIRDPSSIFISFLLPLILLFIYGVGVSLDANKIKLGVVMEDTSPIATSFLQSLQDSTFFEIDVFLKKEEAYKKLYNSSLRGVVIVPFYFTKFYKNPIEKAPIFVIGDGSEPNTANFVQNYVQGAYSKWLAIENIKGKLYKNNTINLETRVWYNEELKSRNFLVPGSLAITMTLVGTLLTALVIAREWERGTMESLISTPVKIWEIMIAKLVPYFILSMGTMAMSVFVSIFIYDIPFRGHLWTLTLVTAIFLIPSLGLGLLISTVARYQLVASQISTIVGFLPAFMLSGFIFEIASMPVVLRYFTYLIPARYFVSSLQTIFLVGDIWRLIIINVIPMLLVGLLFFFIASKRIVKRLD
jgi:ABC-2 type transport system permease protein